MKPFQLMPPTVRRRLVQLITRAAAAREPKQAMRELLTIDADLSGQIDATALPYGEGVHVKHPGRPIEEFRLVGAKPEKIVEGRGHARRLARYLV